MNRKALLGIGVLLPALLWAAGGRIGGDAQIPYERLGAGGAAFAVAGDYKLGGSLGQAGLSLIATNDRGQVFLNGFWKAEDGCTLYNPLITKLVATNGNIALTFLVVNGNQYWVKYVTHEEGGLLLGTSGFTNLVAHLNGAGGAGSTTTVWHNVSSSTNRIRFYVIECAPR